MTDEHSRIARVLSATSPTEALDALTRMQVPEMLDVLKHVTGRLRNELVVAAAKRVRRMETDIGTLTQLVWVLREMRIEDSGQSAEALAYLFLGGTDDDDARSLALDSTEALFLNGSIPAEKLRAWVELVPVDLPVRTRARWIRLLADIPEDWGPQSLRRAYEAQGAHDLIDSLVCSANLSASREALKALYDVAPLGSERARLEGALLAHDTRAAKEAVIRGRDQLTTHQTAALLRAHEFAALHKGFDLGIISADDLVPLRDAIMPEGLSKTQRRFFRQLQDMLRGRPDEQNR